MNNKPLVERLADYAVNLAFDDIPPDAIQMAKWILFDTLGTGLGGYQTELGRKAARYGAELMPGEQATLLGDGRQTTIEGAAFSNGVMVKILGMDDSHRTGSHIASQVIPAVLAISEAYEISGKEIITAIVSAYDLAVRIGTLVRKSQRQRGLDIKGTVGAIAAALAASRCAGLDATGISNAIALAADMSSGTEQYVYEGGLCDTKDLIAGFGARSGVFATRLAASGFYGAKGALDGEYGFFRAFGDGSDLSAFADLGVNFAITTTGFKPHGGCRHTHQAVDAVQHLLAQRPLHTKDIEHISVATYHSAITPSFRVDPNPPSRAVAGLSIRVAISIALTQGHAWPEDYARWDDPEVRRLRQVIDVQLDEEIEARHPELTGCRLQLSMKDGSERSVYLPYMKGEPEFRMTTADLKEKFYILTRNLFSREQGNTIYDNCERLEELEGIGQIMRLSQTREGLWG